MSVPGSTVDYYQVDKTDKNIPFLARLRWFHWGAMMFGMWIIYQIVYFMLWAAYPEHQNFMWRWSLSMSDVTSLAAMVLAIVAMYVVEKRMKQYQEKIEEKEKAMKHEFEKQLNAYGAGFRIFGDALKEADMTKEELRGFFTWIKIMGQKSEVHEIKNQLVGYRYDLQSLEPLLNRILRVYHENSHNIDDTMDVVESLLPLMPTVKTLYGEKLTRCGTLTTEEKEEFIKSIINTR
jgi:hypothetical protein